MEETKHNEGQELSSEVAPPPMTTSGSGTSSEAGSAGTTGDGMLRKLGAVLSVAGIGFMAYLASLHFKGDASSVCDLSASLSCSAVNTSAYSTLLGVPLSFMGVVYFAVMLWAFPAKERSYRYPAILAFTAFSLVFGVYLSGIEKFAIGSFCLFCEGSKLLMVAILFIALSGAKKAGEKIDKRVVLLGAAAGVLFSGAAYLLQRQPAVTLDYTKEAQCLTEKGVYMYGAFGCSHCKRQKELFGEAFSEITYVECDARAPEGGAEPERCLERGVLVTPTWVQETPDGEVLELMEGVYDVAELAEKFDCQFQE